MFNFRFKSAQEAEAAIARTGTTAIIHAIMIVVSMLLVGLVYGFDSGSIVLDLLLAAFVAYCAYLIKKKKYIAIKILAIVSFVDVLLGFAYKIDASFLSIIFMMFYLQGNYALNYLSANQTGSVPPASSASTPPTPPVPPTS